MAVHTFQTPQPVELEIKIPAGDIEVETIDGTESTIELIGSDRLIEQTEVVQSGRTISVEYKKRFGLRIEIGDLTWGTGTLRVRARVPHGSDAVLSTAAADMELRGTFASLETKSAAGDLVLDGNVDGNAGVKTVSGDVRLRVVGGDLTAQSVSGDLTATSVGGDVSAKSVSGDVRIESTREGHVTVQSVSGDIEVGVAAGTNLDVDAGSVSGDLSSEVPLGSDVGNIDGDGPTLVVRGKTVSGDFKVFRAA
jgi:DUF4097 and DUF4098 domain-containing protein YvlB